MCTNQFCTCCQRAYLEGLGDGFKLGFQKGYKAGYVTGYVDGVLRLEPPVTYRREIEEKLAPYQLATAYNYEPEPVKLLPMPLPRKRNCVCFGVCFCNDWEY